MATQNDTPEKKAPVKKAAEKKPPVEREIVRVKKDTEEMAETAKKAATRAVEEPVEEQVDETVDTVAETAHEVVEEAPKAKPERVVVNKNNQPVKAAGEKKSSMPWRICAFACWLIGILGMVGAVIMIMEGNERLMYVGIGVAAVACVIGSLLWKKANRISPCTVPQDGTFGSKMKTFFWNQMGVLFTFIIFLPIGLALMLKSDKLSPQGKKIASIITAVLVAVVGAVSYDYNAPVAEVASRASAEEVQAQAAAGEITIPDGYADKLENDAFWTQYGYSFHFDQDCRTITRSLKIYAGSLADALDAKKLDPCDFCALEPAPAP